MTLTTLFWILLLQFLFGLNYLVSKTLVAYYTPWTWAAMRASFTGLSLVFYLAVAKSLGLSKVKRHFKKLMTLSLAGVVINQTCFLVGLKLTSSYNSALINTLIPLVTLGIAMLIKTESMKSRQALGIAIALFGVWNLTPLSQISFSNKTFLGDLLTVFNVTAYSAYLVLSREFLKKETPIWTTAWVFILGSPLLIALSAPHWSEVSAWAPPPNLRPALLYGLVGGTLMPYVILNLLLRKVKSSTVALFVYLQPAIVGALSYFFNDYRFNREAEVATLFIFIGVFLATLPVKRLRLPD